jgi:hypothetical protein
MDRISKAAHRLWGTVGQNGELHGSPRFATELAAQCNGKLALRAQEVSKWSFGQHLEHLYMASHWWLDRLEESLHGDNAAARIGFWGRGLMAAGFIPRGYFPTIPQLVPGDGTLDRIRPLQETLTARLQHLGCTVNQIKASPGKSLHPRMKWLLSRQWIIFGDVHHRHHLAIMRDIARAAG